MNRTLPRARLWLLHAVMALLTHSAVAQTAAAAPMSDPSMDQLRAALFPEEATSRSFRKTDPPTKDGLCPGGAGGSAGASSRNLEVVGYGGAEAPHADLAIQFANYSDAISAPSRKVLDRLAAVLKEADAGDARFAVAGHTDATGTDKTNLELSCARAIAVRQYLVKQGVAAERLGAYGFGSRKPIEAGATASSANRRVEIRKEE